MSLSAMERKAFLEHGRQRVIASRFRVSKNYVSDVVNGESIPKTREGWKRYSRIQEAVAKELGMTREEAFTDAERGIRASEGIAA